MNKTNLIENPYDWVIHPENSLIISNKTSLEESPNAAVKIAIVNTSPKLDQYNYPYPAPMLMISDEDGWTQLTMSIQNLSEDEKVNLPPQSTMLGNAFKLTIKGNDEESYALAQKIITELNIDTIIKKNGTDCTADWELVRKESYVKIRLKKTADPIALGAKETISVQFKNLKLGSDLKIDKPLLVELEFAFDLGEDNQVISWTDKNYPIFPANKKLPTLYEAIDYSFKDVLKRDKLKQYNPKDSLYLSNKKWEIENLIYLSFVTKDYGTLDLSNANFNLVLDYGKGPIHSMVREEEAGMYDLNVRQEDYADYWSCQHDDPLPHYWDINAKADTKVLLQPEENLLFRIKNIDSKTKEGDGFITITYRGIKGYKDSLLLIRVPKRIPPLKVLKFEVETEGQEDADPVLVFNWACIGLDDQEKEVTWAISCVSEGNFPYGLPYNSDQLAVLPHVPLNYKFKNLKDRLQISLSPDNIASGGEERKEFLLPPFVEFKDFKIENPQKSYVLMDRITFSAFVSTNLEKADLKVQCLEYPEVVVLQPYKSKGTMDFEIELDLDKIKDEDQTLTFNLLLTDVLGNTDLSTQKTLTFDLKALKAKSFDFTRVTSQDETNQIQWNFNFALAPNCEYVIWEKSTEKLLALDTLKNISSISSTDPYPLNPVSDKVYLSDSKCMDFLLLPKRIYDLYASSKAKYIPYAASQKIYSPFLTHYKYKEMDPDDPINPTTAISFYFEMPFYFHKPTSQDLVKKLTIYYNLRHIQVAGKKSLGDCSPEDKLACITWNDDEDSPIKTTEVYSVLGFEVTFEDIPFEGENSRMGFAIHLTSNMNYFFFHSDNLMVMYNDTDYGEQYLLATM